MFIAGLFNAVGFFTLTRALQLVSIVQVNAVSASQSATRRHRRRGRVWRIDDRQPGPGGLADDRGPGISRPRAKAAPTLPNGAEAPAAPTAEHRIVAVPPLQVPAAAVLPREPTTK